jgi:hypothetical protein
MDLPLQSVREEKEYTGAHPFQLTVMSTPTHRRTSLISNSASIKNARCATLTSTSMLPLSDSPT